MRKLIISLPLFVTLAAVIIIITTPLLSTATYGQVPTVQDEAERLLNQPPTPTPVLDPVDEYWNGTLDTCIEARQQGVDLVAVGCDGGSLINERNIDCQEIYQQLGPLLICDPDSVLGKKLVDYLYSIGYNVPPTLLPTTLPPPQNSTTNTTTLGN